MRLLLPQLDKERQTYGLKEKMLATYFIDLLSIAPNTEDAQRMLNWRLPTKNADGGLEGGDFAAAVYQSIEHRLHATGVKRISLEEVNILLDKLNAAADK